MASKYAAKASWVPESTGNTNIDELNSRLSKKKGFIGADQAKFRGEINTVIQSIEQNPKFARLVGYSINCLGNMAQNKHNLDPIVDCGGVDIIMSSLTKHMGTSKIMMESSRACVALAANPHHSEAMGVKGGINLALDFLQKDQKGSGKASLEMIEAMCFDPDHPANIQRLIEAGGVDVLLNALRSDPKNPHVLNLLASTLSKLAKYSPASAHAIANAGGAKVLLDALRRHPELAAFATHTIETLSLLADLDDATQEFIREEGAVSSITAAMEQHPDDEELIRVGTRALTQFATLQDLKNAMETIMYSSMSDQSSNTAETQQAMSIVSNLALIESNIDFIVREGGIPALLNVICSASENANHNENAANIVAAGIRGLGRLLNNEEHAQEFLEEDGIATIVMLLRRHRDIPKIVNACASAVASLINTKAGYTAVLQSEVAVAMMEVLQVHPEYEMYTLKAMDVFSRLATSGTSGFKYVMSDFRVVESAADVLGMNENADVLTATTKFLHTLLDLDVNSMAQPITEYCVEALLLAMKSHPTDREFISAAIALLTALANAHPEIGDFIKELGAEAILNFIREKNPGDKALFRELNVLAGALAGKDRLPNAIEQLHKLATTLRSQPNNKGVLEEMAECAELIATLSTETEKQAVLHERGGISGMPLVFDATSQAVTCHHQEKVLTQEAQIMLNLVPDQRYRKEIVKGKGQPLNSLLNAYSKHPDYKPLGERVLDILTEIAKDPELQEDLYTSGAVEALVNIINSFPDEEQLVSRAVRLLGKLSDNEQHATEVLRRGGGNALMSSIKALMGEEDPLIDALLATGHVAEQSGTSQFVIRSGQMSVLDEVLKVHYANPTVMAAACDCLTSLSMDPEFCIAFARGGGLAMILEGLKRHKNDEDYCSYALSLMENLAEVPENIDDIEKLAGHRVMLDNLAAQPESEAVQLYGIRTEAQCAEHNDPICAELGSNGSVRPVMDTLRRFPNSAAVAHAVAMYLKALARMDKNVPVVHNAGGVDALRWIQEQYPNDEEIQDVVQQALNRLEPDGEFLLLQCHNLSGAKQSALLVDNLGKLADWINKNFEYEWALEHGVMDKFRDIFEAHMNEPRVLEALVKVLEALAENPAFCQAFVKHSALDSLLRAMHGNLSDAPFQQDAILLLERLSEDPKNLTRLQSSNAADQILETMKAHPDHDKIQEHGLKTLTNMAKHSPEMAKYLVDETDAVEVAMEALKNHQDNPDVIYAVTNFINALASNPDNIPKLEEMGALAAVQWAADQFPNHKGIQENWNNVEMLMGGQIMPESGQMDALPDENRAANMFDDYQGNLAEEGEPEDDFLEHVPPPPEPPEDADEVEMDGPMILEAHDAIDPRTAVDVLDDLRQPRENLLKVVNLLGDHQLTPEEMEDLIDQDAIQKLIMALNKFRDDPEMVSAIAKALDRFAINDENITEIVANGGIAALLKALKKHMDKPMTLASGVALLGNLATNDHLKTLIGLQGGIKIIIRIMELYPDQPDLLDKCCYCLANLAHNNPPNMAQIVEFGGIPLIVQMMTTHYSNVDLMDSACCCLSNLCYNNNPNKALIVRTGGARVIVNMIMELSEHANLMMTGFRALGNLAFLKENISIIIEEGAVQGIIKAMKANESGEDMLQLAMAVLGNLASDPKPQCQEVIMKAGCVKQVLVASRDHADNVTLQKAALGCLGNLSNNRENANHICKTGMNQVLKVMTTLDWDEPLVEVALKLIGALACNENNVLAVCEAKGPKAVLKITRAHKKNQHIVKLALMTLSKLAISNESCIDVAKQGGIKGAIDALVEFPDEIKLQVDAIRVLMNLAIVQENAKIIAGNAVAPVLKAIHLNDTNQIFLQVASGFLGNLAIFDAAAELVVQRGALPVILNAIKNNLDYPGLLAKMVRMMYNTLLTTDGTAKQALQDKQALKTVKGLLTLHPGHMQLKKVRE